MFGDHLLLMTAKGAKSGETITTPLVYGREGNDYIIVASKGGAPDNPQWFGNLKRVLRSNAKLRTTTAPRRSRHARVSSIAGKSATACSEPCVRSGPRTPTTRSGQLASFR